MYPSSEYTISSCGDVQGEARPMSRTDEMLILFSKNPNPKAGQQTFRIPRVESVYMGKLSLSYLSYFGPVVWENMLPEEYKNIETLHKFEEDIKKWIPNCKCRLCEVWVENVGKVVTSK